MCDLFHDLRIFRRCISCNIIVSPGQKYMLTRLIELLFEKLLKLLKHIRHIMPACKQFADRKITVTFKLFQKKLAQCVGKSSVIRVLFCKKEK